MDLNKIRKYNYSVRFKDIILSLMNIVVKFDDYSMTEKNPPNTSKIISWIIEALISQLNEIMVIKGDFENLRNIYRDLNEIDNYVLNMGDNLNLELLLDKLRKITVKVMTNIANVTEELNLQIE